MVMEVIFLFDKLILLSNFLQWILTKVIERNHFNYSAGVLGFAADTANVLLKLVPVWNSIVIC